MGTTGSHQPSNHCGNVCRCFLNDKNVKNRDVIRNSSSKWIWSPTHDLILIQCLNNKYYNIPMDIIYLIKDHSFCIDDDYYTNKATICHETYYSKPNQLLNKSLCTQWYQSHRQLFQSFSIALIGNNYRYKQSIIDGLMKHSFPALQLQSNHYGTIRRTLFMNECKISVNLVNTDSDKIHSKINLILLDENDNIKEINSTLQKIQKKRTLNILVKIDDDQKEHNIISKDVQLCRNYNIPYIQVSLNSDQSIQDLFNFVVKYYWFYINNIDSNSINSISIQQDLSHFNQQNITHSLPISEEDAFKQNGYTKITETSLIEAVSINKTHPNHVMIKKSNKIHDAVNGATNKEKLILKHLTNNNKISTAHYIVKYIDFFESDFHSYLVTECLNDYINLKQFTERAHEYIKNGKLKIKQYRKVLKYIFWRICCVIHWLHNQMQCCHLNLFLENVMLKNADFIEKSDGSVIINSKINLKLCDFSRSEIFELKDENMHYGISADLWSIGLMLYHCTVGQPLYSSMTKTRGTGYWALITNNLNVYLSVNNFSKLINGTLLSLILNLFQIHDERIKRIKRINVIEILKHEWFNSYSNKYRKRILTKNLFNIKM